jgi:Tfp pilus assembly ATPase PilU
MKLTLTVPNKFHAERIERVMEALPEERRKDLLFVLEANEKNLQAKTKRILRLSEAKRKGQLIRQVLETKLEDILFEQDCQEPY